MDTEANRRHICRQLTELSPLPVVFAEGTTHVMRYVNPAFCSLVGRRTSDLLGKPFAEAIPEGSNNACVSLLDRVLATGMAENLSHQEHGQTGSNRAFWSYAAWAVLGEGERLAGVMVQVTDTTEAALARQLATAVNESLVISNVRQHELQKAADSAGQAKNRFLAALSHELRTPLTPILAAAQLLERRQDLASDVIEYVRVIKRNVALEARLIDDLLDLNRIIHGKTSLRLSSVDIHESIRQAVETCRPRLEEMGASISLELMATLAKVRGDPVRIQQIFWNLLSNSIKFSRGGTITVSTSNVEGGKIEVNVVDTGEGIDPKSLARLFNAFEQGGNSITRDFGGLGLGLVISKGLAVMHGGIIEARSEGVGKGATFTVTLPTEDGDACLGDSAGVSAEPSSSAPKRILLVEDNLDSGSLMKAALDMEGHMVHHATSVASALRAAAKEQFELLLCDLGLPDGSGFDVVTSLRGRHQIEKAIAISGFGMDDDIRKSKEAGFSGHLTKPVDLDELERLIDRL